MSRKGIPSCQRHSDLDRFTKFIIENNWYSIQNVANIKGYTSPMLVVNIRMEQRITRHKKF